MEGRDLEFDRLLENARWVRALGVELAGATEGLDVRSSPSCRVTGPWLRLGVPQTTSLRTFPILLDWISTFGTW